MYLLYLTQKLCNSFFERENTVKEIKHKMTFCKIYIIFQVFIKSLFKASRLSLSSLCVLESGRNSLLASSISISQFTTLLAGSGRLALHSKLDSPKRRRRLAAARVPNWWFRLWQNPLRKLVQIHFQKWSHNSCINPDQHTGLIH